MLVDIRTVNQRFGILMAMDRLYEGAPYDDVSIQDICSEARVSRSSFYRLFASKYSVATWFQEVALQASIREIGRTRTWQDGIALSIDGFRLAPAVLSAASRGSGSRTLAASYVSLVREYLVDTAVNHLGRELTVALRFQIEFYANSPLMRGSDLQVLGLAGASVPEMAHHLSLCVPHDLYELLNEPTNPLPYRQLTISDLYPFALHVRPPLAVDTSLCGEAH